MVASKKNKNEGAGRAHGGRICGSCDLWERFPDSQQRAGKDVIGECVLNPPVVLDVDENGDILQALPLRYYRERCGQYRPKVN